MNKENNIFAFAIVVITAMGWHRVLFASSNERSTVESINALRPHWEGVYHVPITANEYIAICSDEVFQISSGKVIPASELQIESISCGDKDPRDVSGNRFNRNDFQ